MIPRIVFVAVVAALAAVSCKSSDRRFEQPTGPKSFTTEDYVFDSFGNKLIVQKPKDAKGPVPWLFNVPGGGWVRSYTLPRYQLSEEMAKRGIAIVSAEYRLSSEATWPAQRIDVENAFRYARAHAREWGLEPDRYAVRGESAGSTEAAWLSITQKPACTVLLASPLDFTTFTNAEVTRLLGGHDARDASPIFAVHGGMPPTVLVHGTGDDTVPFSQSEEYRKALRKAGSPVELWRHDKGHVNIPDDVNQRISDYTQKCLGAS